MVVLRFSMQGEDIRERISGKCHVLQFSMQEEIFFEHILCIIHCRQASFV